MAEQSQDKAKWKSIVLKDDHGLFYSVPAEHLDQFRMPDEEVEAFLKSLAGPSVAGAPAASNFVRAAPSGFVRAAATGFDRASPSSFVRASIPSTFVRAAPSNYVRAVPSNFVRAAFPSGFVRATPVFPVPVFGLAVPTCLARVAPSNYVRMAPSCGTPPAKSEPSGAIVQSWLHTS